MERRFKGIWIPCEIWLSEELSLQEKVFLVEIDSLDSEDSGCYASNSYFASFFNLSKARVSQVISSLESKGYISVSLVREGRQVVKRIIHINTPPFPVSLSVKETYHGSKESEEGGKYSKEGIKNTKDPYLENYEDNNISLNNTSNNTDYSMGAKPRKRFNPPSVDEVKEYCQESGYSVDAEKFIDYYTSNGWMVGKNHMKDWKATVRNWARKDKPAKKVETARDRWGAPEL